MVFEQAGSDWGRVKPKTSPLLPIGAVVALTLLYLLIHGIAIDAAPPKWIAGADGNGGNFGNILKNRYNVLMHGGKLAEKELGL